MPNKNLKKLRKQLDALDNKMLNLINKRTNLVKKIIKVKKHKNQIVDKKRIVEVLKKIKKNSIKKKIDPQITKKFWNRNFF